MTVPLGKKPDRPADRRDGPIARSCAVLSSALIFPFALDLIFTGGALTSWAFWWVGTKLLGLPY